MKTTKPEITDGTKLRHCDARCDNRPMRTGAKASGLRRAVRLLALLIGSGMLAQCAFDPYYYSFAAEIPVYTHPDDFRRIGLHREGQTVHLEPPASLQENPEDFLKPTAEHVAWVPGRWEWREDKKFHWLAGSWQVRETDSEWVPGYWQRKGRTWRWLQGYWTEDGFWPVNAQHAGSSYPPPALRAQYPVAPPVWIGGHRSWLYNRYQWAPGYWQSHPLSHHWVAGSWQYGNLGWYWNPGSWRSPGGYIRFNSHRRRGRIGFRRGVTVETTVEDRVPKK